ncbi:NAC domain-containing protein 72-like [Salvia divinorum]|uniref:NAC domain-containing protein 72-like n=1 Tax=Salvia divinorum TaxID=28513 RepID=A0ABD1ICE0_SALDI
MKHERVIEMESYSDQFLGEGQAVNQLYYHSETYRASGDGVWYYFTRRRRKHRHGRVVDRTAGAGYWNVNGPCKHIMHNRREIGLCRLFAYFTGRDSVKIDWLMHEFTAPENRARVRFGATSIDHIVVLCKQRDDSWAVCKMYKAASDSGYGLIRDVVNGAGSSRKEAMTER